MFPMADKKIENELICKVDSFDASIHEFITGYNRIVTEYFKETRKYSATGNVNALTLITNLTDDALSDLYSITAKTIPGFKAINIMTYIAKISEFSATFGFIKILTLLHTENVLSWREHVHLVNLVEGTIFYYNGLMVGTDNYEIYTHVYKNRLKQSQATVKDWLYKALKKMQNQTEITPRGEKKSGAERLPFYLESSLLKDSNKGMRVILDFLKKDEFITFKYELLYFLVSRIKFFNGFKSEEIKTKFLEFLDGLLENGLDPDTELSLNGISARFNFIHVAAINNVIPVSLILIKYGCNLEAKWLSNDENVMLVDVSPLILATDNNNINMMEVLLDNNADCNTVSKTGLTVLMIAVMRRHVEAVKTLLFHPKSKNIIDFEMIEINLETDNNAPDATDNLPKMLAIDELFKQAKIEREKFNQVKQAEEKQKIIKRKINALVAKESRESCLFSHLKECLLELKIALENDILYIKKDELYKVAIKANKFAQIPNEIVIDKEMVGKLITLSNFSIYSITDYLRKKYLPKKINVEEKTPTNKNVTTVNKVVSPKSKPTLTTPIAMKTVSPKSKNQQRREKKALKSPTHAKPLPPVIELAPKEYINNKIKTFLEDLKIKNTANLIVKLDNDLCKLESNRLKDICLDDAKAILKQLFPFGFPVFMKKLFQAINPDLITLLNLNIELLSLDQEHLSYIETATQKEEYDYLADAYDDESAKTACAALKKLFATELICDHLINNKVDYKEFRQILLMQRYFDHPALFATLLQSLKEMPQKSFHAGIMNFMNKIAFDRTESSGIGKIFEPEFFTAVLNIENFIDPDALNDDTLRQQKFNLLHACVDRQNKPIYFILINYIKNIEVTYELNPNSINYAEENGGTALLLAAKSDDTTILEDLIKRRANVNARTQSKETILTISKAKNYHSALPILLANGAEEALNIDTSGIQLFGLFADQTDYFDEQYANDACQFPDVITGLGL